MTGAQDADEGTHPNRRTHAGMALFWLLAVSAALVASVSVIAYFTDHTSTAALYGIAMGMWIREYAMAYVRHGIGVLNPRWATNV